MAFRNRNNPEVRDALEEIEDGVELPADLEDDFINAIKRGMDDEDMRRLGLSGGFEGINQSLNIRDSELRADFYNSLTQAFYRIYRGSIMNSENPQQRVIEAARIMVPLIERLAASDARQDGSVEMPGARNNPVNILSRVELAQIELAVRSLFNPEIAGEYNELALLITSNDSLNREMIQRLEEARRINNPTENLARVNGYSTLVGLLNRTQTMQLLDHYIQKGEYDNVYYLALGNSKVAPDALHRLAAERRDSQLAQVAQRVDQNRLAFNRELTEQIENAVANTHRRTDRISGRKKGIAMIGMMYNALTFLTNGFMLAMAPSPANIGHVAPYLVAAGAGLATTVNVLSDRPAFTWVTNIANSLNAGRNALDGYSTDVITDEIAQLTTKGSLETTTNLFADNSFIQLMRDMTEGGQSVFSLSELTARVNLDQQMSPETKRLYNEYLADSNREQVEQEMNFLAHAYEFMNLDRASFIEDIAPRAGMAASSFEANQSTV